MYEAFYKFSQTPFTRDIPPESLYRGNDTEETVGRLRYAAEKQLFTVVILSFMSITSSNSWTD